MKKKLQLCFLCYLLVFFFCCQNQSQTDQTKANISPVESALPDSKAIIAGVDTITASNAPSRITRKIRKDKDGNLLFAAYEDIIRYDGTSFTKLTKEEGLESFDAFDAFEDKEGKIWIASTHFGIFLYDQSAALKTGAKTITHFTTKEGLSHNRTMCIEEDKAGSIWIGTQGGISYYNNGSGQATPINFKNFNTNSGLTNNDINIIKEDKSGKIWVGTRGTLCVYAPSLSRQSDDITFTEITNEEGKPFGNVWSIIEDKKGNMWLGGQNGLWRFNGVSFTKFTAISVTAVYEDRKGTIWFTHGTAPHTWGLSLYDEKNLRSEKPEPKQIHGGGGMFFGISEDKEGAIWVGTLKGVFRYDGKSVSYFKDKQAKD